MIIQTNYHTVAQLKLYMNALPESVFVNWVIYKQEWGGTPKKEFPQKHNDTPIYAKGTQERIKDSSGHNIRWQKPLKLMDRLLAPFTDYGDIMVDPFMGSGSTDVWCIKRGRGFVGIENDEKVFRIEQVEKSYHLNFIAYLSIYRQTGYFIFLGRIF